MKRTLLFTLTMLLMVSNTEANNSEITNQTHDHPRYIAPKTIQFSEAGIFFRVHPNGQVSYAYEQKIRRQYVNKNNRRYVLRETPKKFRVIKPHRSTKVKIGKVLLRFDHLGKIEQIGSVDIDYNRSRVSKVGHIRVQYNRSGQAHYIGKVKSFPRKLSYH